MHSFRKLDIWKDSMNLAVGVYEITKDFPLSEIYGLTSQIRRCAISIPANIAEGTGGNSNKVFNKHLGIATGSSYELESQLIIAGKVGYVPDSQIQSIITNLHSIQKRMYKFKQTLL